MKGYVSLPAFRAPSPIDFTGINSGIDAVGKKLEQNRLLDQNKAIGEAIQSGGYGGGADAAFAQGNLSVGGQLAGLESSDIQQEFQRNRLLAQDKRTAASDARSQELHGLNVEKAKSGLHDQLIGRVAGLAQAIRNETDPERKALMVHSLVSAHPKLQQQFSAYGLDPANPDPTMDMIIAEAQGLTAPKASEYKTFKPDQGIYRAGPQGLEVVREPQIGAGGGKPPAGYRYMQDGQTLEAIPGGPATKLPSGDAAKLAALQTAETSFEDAKKFYQQSDFVDRGNQMLNRGKAGRAERTVRLAVESALRAMTGAAAPDSEVASYMNLFGPSAWDTPATAKDKLDRLESFLRNVRANIEQGRGPAAGATQLETGTVQPAARLRFNPETGELE